MLENMMVSTSERRYHFEAHYKVGKTCGCGSKALYEVYEDHQPHCHACLLEATDGTSMVPVRRLR